MPEWAPAPLTDSAETIRAIQEYLRALRLYSGPVDGRAAPALTSAIQNFQRGAGVEPDGVADEALLRRLKSQVEVQRLNRQLETHRDEQTAAAELALVTSGRMAALRARAPDHPTLDAGAADACLKAPAPRCLLIVALEGARGLGRAEQRDWAISDIVATQVRAGLEGEAEATIGLLSDPRSILMALRSVAESHARAGRVEAAMAAAAAVPDPRQRVEALAAIAALRAAAGDTTAAVAAVAAGVDDLASLPGPGPDPRLVARFATAAALSGDRDRARSLFDQAVAASGEPAERSAVAEAMAEAGLPEAALSLADSVLDQALRDPVLVASSSSLARAGSLDEARQVADRVGPGRYRAVALAALAVEAARQGRIAEARAAVDAARALAPTIRASYARAYAESRIALALKALGADREAAALGKDVGDAALRAYALGTVAAGRPADDALGKQALVLTDRALAAVVDPVARTRTLCALALDRRTAGDAAAARRQAQRAMVVARGIGDTWGRVRAIIAVAGTLVDIE
ncbi:MAG: peptidoglycan-binding protein [Alphaproteobacteria bacterium]